MAALTTTEITKLNELSTFYASPEYWTPLTTFIETKYFAFRKANNYNRGVIHKVSGQKFEKLTVF